MIMELKFRDFIESEKDWDTPRTKIHDTPISIRNQPLRQMVMNLAYRVNNLERTVTSIKSRTPISPDEEDPRAWVLPQ